jgi:hypothetical protein
MGSFGHTYVRQPADLKQRHKPRRRIWTTVPRLGGKFGYLKTLAPNTHTRVLSDAGFRMALCWPEQERLVALLMTISFTMVVCCIMFLPESPQKFHK